MPREDTGSGSEEDAYGQTDTKRKRKLKKEQRKKDKKRRATMAASASDDEDDEEDRRLQKKLRKLLKRQRQQQQQQQQQPSQATPPAVPLVTIPPPRPKPAFVPAISTGAALTQEELWRRAERARRFASEEGAANSARAATSQPSCTGSRQQGGEEEEEEEEDRGGGNGGGRPLVGTSRVVERDYTRTVDPRDVRPVPVLEEALRRAQAHWATHEEYAHACSRLKSIRQDLRVQHAETPFTVKVYETHARIALESGDLSEFLLCAARLDELRAQGLPTAADEFAAYRLLHALYLGDPVGLRSVLMSIRGGGTDSTAAAVTRGGKKGSDHREGSSSSSSSSSSGRGQGKGEASSLVESAPVRHALEVLRAHVQGNFLRFFRLYQRAPHMSAYLMDFLLLRTRRAAVETAVAAYGPTSLSLPMLAQTLAFDDVEECRAFAVGKMGCVVLPDNPLSLDVRASRRVLLGSGKDDGGGGKRGKGK